VTIDELPEDTPTVEDAQDALRTGDRPVRPRGARAAL
jgi:hypothetical protein